MPKITSKYYYEHLRYVGETWRESKARLNKMRKSDKGVGRPRKVMVK